MAAGTDTAPSDTPATDGPRVHDRPGTGITLTGWLMAGWCVGFAVVNIVYESTDRFADGEFADYTSGITVMAWLVVGLKMLGALVALLSVAKRPRFLSPAVVTVLVWGAFATLGVYALGSAVMAVGIISGLSGTADQVDVVGVGYVLFFLSGAAGYGVLAISYSRRHGVRKGLVVLGLFGAPVVLGLVLLAVPALLAAAGLMPAP